VKGHAAWILVFVCALVLTFFVELGDNFFGLPAPAIQVLFAANLTVFLWLLARLLGRPIGGALDNRRADIADQLEQAAQKLTEAEQLRAEVRERLDKVEQEVTQLTDRAQQDGQAEAQEIAAQTRGEQERFLKRVDEEIARRQAEARQNLAEEAAALTAQLTRELLERELTDTDRQRILNRSLAAMRAAEKK
jgi:F-type H+-transporting ATPase subunit b